MDSINLKERAGLNWTSILLGKFLLSESMQIYIKEGTKPFLTQLIFLKKDHTHIKNEFHYISLLLKRERGHFSDLYFLLKTPSWCRLTLQMDTNTVTLLIATPASPPALGGHSRSHFKPCLCHSISWTGKTLSFPLTHPVDFQGFSSLRSLPELLYSAGPNTTGTSTHVHLCL